MNDKIPIFPLPLVLLPGEKLPLHIFEAKYKKMVEYCLKHNQKFGIVNSRNNDTLSIGCTLLQIYAAEVFRLEAKLKEVEKLGFYHS